MKYRLLVFMLLAGMLLTFTACNQGPGADEDYIVTISTPMGDMKVILYDETPLHKENFIELAKAGAYDETNWHRVIEGFMIQGGDIYQPKGELEPESARIPAEIVPGFYHTKGALAAARQPDEINPDKLSSGSQFYIVQGTSFKSLTTNMPMLNDSLGKLFVDPKHASLLQKFRDLNDQQDYTAMSQLALDCRELVETELSIDLSIPFPGANPEIYRNTPGAPHLDGEYTVFGKVVEGFDVIDKIAAVKKAGSKPIENVSLAMEVDVMAKREITSKYGYQYNP